jgi:pimeloyl-ACP methyl ester carboxylesterase
VGHRPFLVLADYLTRRGIAVLRVDDRGVGGSTGDVATATSEDLAGDVLAGVTLLKGRAEIDGTKIGLVGHSEGGMIAPMAAVRSEDVAYLVLMAGTAIPGEQLMYRQSALIRQASGEDPKAIRHNEIAQRQIFAILKREKDDAAAEKQIRAVFAKLAALRTRDMASPPAAATEKPERKEPERGGDKLPGA